MLITALVALFVETTVIAAPCAISGESIDADPKGLRVHDAPALSGAEVGRLYPGMDPEVFYHEEKASLAEGLVGAMFTVDGVDGDWLHISEIDPVTDGLDPSGGVEPVSNFQGAGWVHASQVRLSPRRWEEAYREPSDVGPRVEGKWYAGKIIGCRGDWAQVHSPEGSVAWMRSEPNTERVAKIRRASSRPGTSN
jgi:hypothetical protein